MMQAVQFAFHDRVQTIPADILNGKSEKDFLLSKFQKGCIFGLDNLMSSGCYKLGGWAYHFDMPKFLVKQYGEWREYFAPNKTALRKVLYGRIDKIVAI